MITDYSRKYTSAINLYLLWKKPFSFCLYFIYLSSASKLKNFPMGMELLFCFPFSSFPVFCALPLFWTKRSKKFWTKWSKKAVLSFVRFVHIYTEKVVFLLANRVWYRWWWRRSLNRAWGRVLPPFHRKLMNYRDHRRHHRHHREVFVGNAVLERNERQPRLLLRLLRLSRRICAMMMIIIIILRIIMGILTNVSMAVHEDDWDRSSWLHRDHHRPLLPMVTVKGIRTKRVTRSRNS